MNRQPAIIGSSSRYLALTSLMLSSYLLGAMLISNLSGGIGDEAVHAFQISWFLNGTYQIFESVTVIPAYHAIIALLLKVSGNDSLEAMRVAQQLLSWLCIPAFLILCYRIHNCFETAFYRSIQFFFLPILFPFFFVIYTDVFSLTVTLFMIERAIAGRSVQSSIFGLAAILLRQTNLVWVAFTLFLILSRDDKPLLSIQAWKLRLKENKLVLFCFGLIFSMTIVFIFMNEGVAVGDREQHELTFNLSNVYFMLLVIFLVFLPWHIAQLSAIFKLLQQFPFIMPCYPVIGFVYWLTYSHTHPYNSPQLSYYLHNLMLHYTADFHLAKLGALVAICWTSLSLLAITLISKEKRTLQLAALFGVLAIIPLPLIEQRYYLVAISLFLAIRPKVKSKVEGLSLLYSMLWSLYLLYNISQANFFL